MSKTTFLFLVLVAFFILIIFLKVPDYIASVHRIKYIKSEIKRARSEKELKHYKKALLYEKLSFIPFMSPRFIRKLLKKKSKKNK